MTKVKVKFEVLCSTLCLNQLKPRIAHLAFEFQMWDHLHMYFFFITCLHTMLRWVLTSAFRFIISTKKYSSFTNFNELPSPITKHTQNVISTHRNRYYHIALHNMGYKIQLVKPYTNCQ